LAHGSTEGRAQTLANMKRALKAGRRRSHLILAGNVARARQAGNPDHPWLEKLAAVINDEAALSILDDWPAWKAA